MPSGQLSGQELKQQLQEVQEQTKTLFTNFMELVPPGHSLSVGGKTKSRAELKKATDALTRQIGTLATAAQRSSRRKKPLPEGVTKSSNANKTGGLKKPFLYSPELINLLTHYNLGRVDPNDPKSQTINDLLKKTAFSHGVSTSYTITRLFSIMVNVNKSTFKEGSNYKMPLDVVKSKIPTAYAVLKDDPDFDFNKFTWINQSRIISALMIHNGVLTPAQKELIKTHEASAAEIDAKIKEIHAKYRAIWDADKAKEVSEKPAKVAAPKETKQAPVAAAAPAAAASSSTTNKSPKPKKS